ncbi:MAG: hypothetical protein Q8P58_02065 [Candidatus Adlerbacteria bacterium]|nr:hypothetical protein [Candidatus Adlerbacteria bacterium]
MNTRALPLPTYAKIILGGSLVAAVATVALFAFSVFAEAGPEITTTIHTAAHATTTEAAIGTSVHAEARVATTTGTTTPTGTVDFDLYAGTSCTGTPTTHAGVALVGGIAESAATTVPAAGLSYRVTYNGDTNNVPSEGACTALTALGSDASITTSLSTTTALVGAQVYDTATLHNVTTNASGTVAYKVYTNNTCSAGVQNAGTKNVSNAVVPNSDTLEFNSAGTFYWQAVYSGDSQNDAATSTCTSEVLTILSTSTPTGRIIVDKVTVPSGATTTFNFNAQGGGYNDFSLADGSSPNEQVLALGIYRVSENSKSGWELTSAMCSRNGATSISYTPGSAITLNSGDTVSCVFTNTKATTTPGDDDDDKDDNGKHKGFVCGLPFGIIKKVFNDIPLPFGIFDKFGSSWDEDCDDWKGTNRWHDDDDDEDDDDEEDDDDDRGKGLHEQMEKIKEKFNKGRD